MTFVLLLGSPYLVEDGPGSSRDVNGDCSREGATRAPRGKRRDTVVATQTLVQTLTRPLVESTESIDWETSTGPADGSLRARLERGPFTYQGGGDPHWRGQCCHEDPQEDAEGDERVVIMSCGCRASVPWWALEPLRA